MVGYDILRSRIRTSKESINHNRLKRSYQSSVSRNDALISGFDNALSGVESDKESACFYRPISL